MRGIIVIGYTEMWKLPISEFLRRMRERFVALKVITGYGFDDGKMRISDVCGWEYSFMITRADNNRPTVGSPTYKKYMEMFPDKVRGKTIDLNKIYEIHLWDYHGTQSLYQTTFWQDGYDDPIPKWVIEEYEKIMDQYRKGISHCSDCGKEIDRKTGNVYFAGRYCDDCWLGRTGRYKNKGGWQKVESLETYD